MCFSIVYLSMNDLYVKQPKCTFSSIELCSSAITCIKPKMGERCNDTEADRANDKDRERKRDGITRRKMHFWDKYCEMQWIKGICNLFYFRCCFFFLSLFVFFSFQLHCFDLSFSFFHSFCTISLILIFICTLLLISFNLFHLASPVQSYALFKYWKCLYSIRFRTVASQHWLSIPNNWFNKSKHTECVLLLLLLNKLNIQQQKNRTGTCVHMCSLRAKREIMLGVER